MAEQSPQWRHHPRGSDVIVSDKETLDIWRRWGRRRSKVRFRRPLFARRWYLDVSLGVEVGSPVDKAESALQDYLSSEQWQEYRRNNSFTVIGQNSQKPYSVQIGRVLDADTHYCIWTAYSHYHVPTADTLLSLALMIQLDEPRFLETAVATRMPTGFLRR